MSIIISVIMPVFNQERYVADAIKCILSQTYKNFEFIIVDDGSTDRTVEIIKSFDDKRIRLICAPHEGYVSALRKATHEAQGKWLARMDSDDLCSPERLEKQLNFLEAHPECVFLTTVYGIVTPNDKFLAPPKSSKWHYVEPSDITLAKKLFCDPATLFNRQIALEIDYDENLGNESPLWYRLLDHGKGVILDEPLYYIRWRIGSFSRGQIKNAAELHYQVRFKYDNSNAVKIERNTPNKIDIRNEKRAVYYSVTAGDFRAARKTAYETWRRFPLNLETLKLMLISIGMRRRKAVEGPCQVNFSPISKPF
jgi:glycosyltransferase involved in cell wall biosynthesis